MTRPPRNTAASVRARLLRLAQERREDFQLVLLRYANERLLYRLAQSAHGVDFVLKGAALFTLWMGRPHRATRDLDLLGFGASTQEHVRRVFAEVIGLDFDDGVLFDSDSLEVGPIREDREYGGIRVLILARITAARVRLQVDIGFGDAITPAAEVVRFPTLLDLEAPMLRAYPRETVVAEKLEAMVQLGMANSRMKDFFDVLVLARTFEFEGDVLVQAIRATFARRRTELPAGLPIALTPEFTKDAMKTTQWTAFLRKSGTDRSTGDLASVAAEIASFAALPLRVAASGGPWGARWPAGGAWLPRVNK